MKHELISFLFLLVMSAGGGSLLLAGQEKDKPGTPVPITPLHQPCETCAPRESFEVNTGIDDRERLVVRDQKAWGEVWKRIYSLTSPTPPLPEIDFTRELVVVVTLGTRPTGGYGIVIDGAADRGDRIEVTVRNVSPGKNCFTTQATTAPVDIVRLPPTERCVVFRETEVVHECK